MTIYIIQVFMIGYLGLLIKPNKTEIRKRWYLIIVFMILTVISGIRAYSVGADTLNYVNLFNSTQYTGILNTRIEPGFTAYLKLLHVFSDDPRILIVVSSIICIGAVTLFTFRFSKDVIISMMLYVLMGFYFGQMNTMRQSLVLSVSEIAFMLILSEKRNLIRIIIAVALIFIATSIHTIAVVSFVPLILIICGKKDIYEETDTVAGKTFLAVLGISAAVFAGYSFVMSLASRLFPEYSYYFISSRWNDSNYNASLFNTIISLVFALTGAFVFGNRKLNGIQRFAVLMLGFSIIFTVLSMRMEIWNRIAGMFTLYTSILWAPEFSSGIQNKKDSIIMKNLIIIGGIAYMLVVLILRPEWNLVVPYVV